MGFYRDGGRLVGGLGLGLRAQAELDEGAGVGGDFGLPAVVALELLHGGDAFGVPGAGGFACQVALLDEGGLDLGGAVGVHSYDWVVVDYALGSMGRLCLGVADCCVGCAVGAMGRCEREAGCGCKQDERRDGGRDADQEGRTSIRVCPPDVHGACRLDKGSLFVLDESRWDVVCVGADFTIFLCE